MPWLGLSLTLFDNPFCLLDSVFAISTDIVVLLILICLFLATALF